MEPKQKQPQEQQPKDKQRQPQEKPQPIQRDETGYAGAEADQDQPRRQRARSPARGRRRRRPERPGPVNRTERLSEAAVTALVPEAENTGRRRGTALATAPAAPDSAARMIHSKESQMARKDQQKQPAERQPDDDMEKGTGPGRDPEIENPGADEGRKSDRGDQEKEMPSQGDQDEMDEPEK
jgi:hypothetical protein